MAAILWGRDAGTLKPHLGPIPWVESAHPSPLAAYRGAKDLDAFAAMLTEDLRQPTAPHAPRPAHLGAATGFPQWLSRIIADPNGGEDILLQFGGANVPYADPELASPVRMRLSEALALIDRGLRQVSPDFVDVEMAHDAERARYPENAERHEQQEPGSAHRSAGT